tara:strand:+ start:413 stop:571 length:159 start_codon:yes stop_codon:yes gene_type:complete
MPKYRITFEFEDEVEAEDELEALIISTSDIAEWIGSEADVEEIKEEEEKDNG